MWAIWANLDNNRRVGTLRRFANPFENDGKDVPQSDSVDSDDQLHSCPAYPKTYTYVLGFTGGGY